MVGVAVAVLGTFLALTPAQTTSLETTTLSDGQWTDVSVPALADISGRPVQVTVAWGAPTDRCVGFCPTTLPFRVLVFDCASSPCSANSTGSYEGTSDYAVFAVDGFSATPGHHYQVWAQQSSPGGGATEFRIAMVTPVGGSAPGLGLLVIGTVATVYGVRAAGPARPARSGAGFL